MLVFVQVTLSVLGGLLGAVLVLMLTNKVWRGAREGFEQRQRTELAPKVLAYIQAEQGRFGDFVGLPLRRLQRRVMEWMLLDQIRSVRGRHQARLTAAFEELGYVAIEHRKLRDRRWWVRVEGAEKLGRMMSRSAVDDLIAAMEDPVPEVRIRAAKALGAIGGFAAIETLITALRNTDRWSTLRIADIMSQLGSSAVEPLLVAFPRLPVAARVPAVEILGRLRSHLAVPLLRSLLGDQDADVRARAANALGMIAHPAVTSALIEAFADPTWPVRAMVAKALGRIPGTESVEALRKALTDPEWWVRANAAEALLQKGEPGHRALIATLDGEDAFAAQKAAWMLQEAGVLDALLARVAGGSDSERSEALGVLGKLVALKRTDLLNDIARRHPDPTVRGEVTRLLRSAARVEGDVVTA